MNKHVHCDLIKAWADGEEIEWFDDGPEQWRFISCPAWCEGIKYRIKPKQPMYRLYISEDDLVNVVVRDFSEEESKCLKLLEKRTNINWLTDWLPLPFKPKE